MWKKNRDTRQTDGQEHRVRPKRKCCVGGQGRNVRYWNLEDNNFIATESLLQIVCPSQHLARVRCYILGMCKISCKIPVHAYAWLAFSGSRAHGIGDQEGQFSRQTLFLPFFVLWRFEMLIFTSFLGACFLFQKKTLHFSAEAQNVEETLWNFSKTGKRRATSGRGRANVGHIGRWTSGKCWASFWRWKFEEKDTKNRFIGPEKGKDPNFGLAELHFWAPAPHVLMIAEMSSIKSHVVHWKNIRTTWMPSCAWARWGTWFEHCLLPSHYIFVHCDVMVVCSDVCHIVK